MPFMYKIFDEKKSSPNTLYHGVNGKKRLPMDIYVTARRKIVRDAKGAPSYESGFHVLSNVADCFKYLRLFKGVTNKRVCRVYVPTFSSMWDKRKRRGVQVKLAGVMCVFSDDWKNRLAIEPPMLEGQRDEKV